MDSKKIVAIALLSSGLFSETVFAETAYQRWLRMAQSARSSGNYDTALTYYQRAANVSPNGFKIIEEH